jgi:chemotaxis protein methyltransferase CheR
MYTDPALSDRAYTFLAELVYRHSRIRLGPDKQAFVAGRLAGRLRQIGCHSYEDYCSLLASAGATDEAEQVIDLVSTNHTQFFREPDHFDYLAQELLPEACQWAARAGRPVQVWCAAAASGEEAYSLAIILAEYQRSRPGTRWILEASDISRRMLDRCRSGIYEADRVKLPDPGWLARYFRRGFGERAGLYRIKPELRSRLGVSAINLFQPAYPLPREQDAIFCRNVMIYFDQDSRQTLAERLFDQLAPGGHLFVGHAESLLGLRHRFRQVRPAVYVRPA